MKDILLVDGYNIIGAWPELRILKNKDLNLARDQLIEKMAEYQAFTGIRVMLVFDAHMVPGVGKKYKNHRVQVIYTRENETADERIEKLVKELKNVVTRIYVATSDFTEQSVIFGSGALRKSARELQIEMETAEKGIKKDVENRRKPAISTRISLSKEMAEIFEKWRRGDS
ncbi:NYN domain-containing protein [Alkalihalobacterium chitinilyticum]|uniref:NYN domain-containing protein n=1 Tax=Alkalihalobacterium chitinilyticum TaxID=2980103 RepID=A0ABT5VKJ9_9BACI|nr:NYN domain-containing protein [Alkalihalobacterium chitinilyticum]MDE5415741.1 NYN domain-containing protein [Alkalihalobacterium chitinilyticum]